MSKQIMVRYAYETIAERQITVSDEEYDAFLKAPVSSQTVIDNNGFFKTIHYYKDENGELKEIPEDVKDWSDVIDDIRDRLYHEVDGNNHWVVENSVKVIVNNEEFGY